jgi:hypothetical protein
MLLLLLLVLLRCIQRRWRGCPAEHMQGRRDALLVEQ